MVEPETAWQLAWIAFLDILVFFGVLLLGFAYLVEAWRSRLGAQHAWPSSRRPSAAAERVLVGVDS